MAFKVKKYPKNEFYETYIKWCDDHKFPRISDLWLPEFCFVCYDEETPIYVSWFWFTNSKIAWQGFMASNKKYSHKKKVGGMDFLFTHIENYAKRKNIVTVFTTSSTDSIEKGLVRSGYIVGDTANHYFKIIK